MKSASHDKKPPSIKLTPLDESEDEIYKEFKELQKKQKKEASNKLKALKSIQKNIKSSTPTQARNSRKKVNPEKEILFLEISPIRRSVTNTDDIDDEESLQIKRINKENLIVEEKESSHIRELKDMIAEFRLNRELSALNASEQTGERDLDSILREFENNKISAPLAPSQSPINSPPAKIEKVEKLFDDKRKKTVFFAPEPENKISLPITLKPGKWRKSLAAWRKSHNPKTSDRRSSRRFVGLFPIKSDPNIIKRFTEKLEESLSKCK